MPAQKRLFEEEEEEENGALNGEMNHEENKEDVLESDRSPSENNGDKDDEFVVIKLSDVRKEVQCPICLGIIRKTRTVMECLHRFCRECIDKSMRLGNNECPTCRTHCPSRRSLRDDPNYDALIAALYPEIDKYEQEEFALQEYEKALNQQIQESISQTLQRQSEALGKKRYPKSRTKRSQGNYRTSHVRARRNGRSTVELQGSDDTEGMKDEDGAKGSSGDELIEIRSKRCKRGAEAQFSPHSPTTAADDGSDENAPEVSREFLSPSRALAWGKNGHRSHTRVNGKNARNSRLAKLIDNLRSLEENDNELGVCLMLVPFDEKRMPSLQQPYLYCRPTLSVRHLCQYVSLQTAVQADEVEICLVKEQQANIIRAAGSVDLCKNNLQVLKEQETLADLKPDNFSCGHLLMAYKRRLLNSTATSLR